ncbi:MAG TPA: 30S ribosome-binding factor RbfA [Anaerolineae bacterium]|nr:30S ribosome-binding factor RbfA [Anaerolineae bacterium]
MVSINRAQRIADRIFEELSIIFLREISDPRIVNVSVTGVKIDRELTFADVYISSLDGKNKAPQILNGLNHAKGFIRKELASRIQLRVVPNLRFHWDPTPDQADRIDKLIASLHNQNQLPDENNQIPDDK